MTSHLPPSLLRKDSLRPGGSPAERAFDQAKLNAEWLRFPRTPIWKLIERIRRLPT